MKPNVVCLLLLSSCLCACGDDAAAPAAETLAPVSAAEVASVAPSGDFSRQTFVLCPALEDHADELAAIVGFVRNPERAIAAGRFECAVRGKGGDFARVSVLPAMVQSTKQYAEMSFDAPAGPLPEVGPEAMFVAHRSQPHVVFRMGQLIIDVDAESMPTPSREKMVDLAKRVKEILTQANS